MNDTINLSSTNFSGNHSDHSENQIVVQKQRQKTGCITCRLRKKRCDERQPYCQACERLGIECLGFKKSRPEWLRGSKHKEEKERIKSDWKKKVNKIRYQGRKGSMENEQNFDPSTIVGSINGDPLPSFDVVQNQSSSSIRNNDEGQQIWQMIGNNDENETTETLIGSSVSSKDSPGLIPLTSLLSEERYEVIQSSSLPFELGMPRPPLTSSKQIEYLYHWLHAVLPIQYRFAAQRMAGLITPLALTKPVILRSVGSLAALHLGAKRKEGEEENSLIAITNYGDSINRLRSLTTCNNNDFLTSEDVVIPALFTISFHLFSGGTSLAWRECLAISQKCLSAILIFASSSAATNNDNNNQRINSIQSNQIWQNYRPLIGIMIWMDIFGSVTMGIGSQLLPAYRVLLNPLQESNENFIEMSETMGCDNATMLALAEIASLVEWKENEERKGQLSVSQLVQKSLQIQASLNLSSFQKNGHNEVSFLYQKVFHNAVKVYLASVVNGNFPRVPEIEAAVEETKNSLIALEFHAGSNLTQELNRGLILPITIAGCHSYKESQKQIFRNALQNLGPEAAQFGNSSSALKLMEEVWRKRERIEWEQAISFTNNGNFIQSQQVCWRRTMLEMGWEAGLLLI